MQKHDMDPRNLKETIYQEIVKDPTDAKQLFQYFSKAERYGFDPNPEISEVFTRLKNLLSPRLEGVETWERNFKWANDLSNAVISFMENVLPDEAKKLLPEEWKQQVVRYFVEKTQQIPEDISYEDLCRKLGIGKYDRSIGADAKIGAGPYKRRIARFNVEFPQQTFLPTEDTFSSLMTEILAVSADEMTGLRTAYFPLPYDNRAAYEEWQEVRKKMNELSKNLADAIRMTVPSEQEKAKKIFE